MPFMHLTWTRAGGLGEPQIAAAATAVVVVETEPSTAAAAAIAAAAAAVVAAAEGDLREAHGQHRAEHQQSPHRAQ